MTSAYFWTQDQLDLLYEYYGILKDETLAEKIGRPVPAIRSKAAQLHLIRTQNFITASDVAGIFGIDMSIVTKNWITNGHLKAKKSTAVGRGKNKPWVITDQELERFIKGRLDLYNPYKIDRQLYPYWRNLVDKIIPSGFIPQNDRAWTEHDDAILLNHRQNLSQKELALKLKRTPDAVHARLVLLKEKGRLIPYKKNWKNRGKDGVIARIWTPTEDRFLRENWGRLLSPLEMEQSGKKWGNRFTAKDAARHLNRTLSSCWTRASRLGLINENWQRKDQDQEAS